MSDGADELITRAELAHRRGVSRAMVTKKLASEHMSPACGPGKLVQWPLVNQLWDQGKIRTKSTPSILEAQEQGRPNSPAPNRGEGGKTITLEGARRAVEVLRAEKLALELARMRAEMVSARDVEEAVTSALRVVRDRFTNLPVRAVGSVRSAPTEREAMLILSAEVREVLRGAADDVLRRIAEGLGDVRADV